MKFQANVKTDGVVPQIWWAMGVADLLHQEMFNKELEVTSVNDSHEHNPKSLHHQGEAFDIRTRHMTSDFHLRFFKALKLRLDPRGFDTVDEGNHIHVEYQPHTGDQPWVGNAED